MGVRLAAQARPVRGQLPPGDSRRVCQRRAVREAVVAVVEAVRVVAEAAVGDDGEVKDVTRRAA